MGLGGNERTTMIGQGVGDRQVWIQSGGGTVAIKGPNIFRQANRRGEQAGPDHVTPEGANRRGENKIGKLMHQNISSS